MLPTCGWVGVRTIIVFVTKIAKSATGSKPEMSNLRTTAYFNFFLIYFQTCDVAFLKLSSASLLIRFLRQKLTN